MTDYEIAQRTAEEEARAERRLRSYVDVVQHTKPPVNLAVELVRNERKELRKKTKKLRAAARRAKREAQKAVNEKRRIEKEFFEHPMIRAWAHPAPQPTRKGAMGMAHVKGALALSSVRSRYPFMAGTAGPVTLYVIVDQRDLVKYVGITRRAPEERLRQHLKRPSSNGLRAWFEAMRRSGTPPRIIPLKQVSEESWEDEEMRLIAWCKRFGRLLNVDPGGKYRDDHGTPFPEAIARARRIRKEVNNISH